MDVTRMTALEQKARTIGLTDAEAEELGHLLAESQGRPYSNSADMQEETRTANGLARSPRARAHAVSR